jgi:hypothetical protein
MLKIENVKVYGWEAAIRGMRNPLNSWARSDSMFCPLSEPDIGEDDLDLMKRLADGGSTHAKYRRMIIVTLDITAPLYWWKEFDTYKVGTVANSCSTMHKIHSKEFVLDDFSREHLISAGLSLLERTIADLNDYREMFIEWDKQPETVKAAFGHDKKNAWWQMIQLLPTSYNQRRTILLNYEVLAAIYRDRRKHKLDEWHAVCDWIEGLPHSEIITR